MPCDVKRETRHGTHKDRALTLRMTHDALRKSCGFTLLEVMLALVLFATGTMAVMDLLRCSQAAMAEGENVAVALHLAQRRLEELRNTAYGSVANEAKAAIASPAGYSRFNREVTVTTSYTNLKQVVVTVSWNAPGGEASISLQTYRSNV